MIRTITTISYGRRRRHIAVTHARAGWVLQVAHPTEHGYRFDEPCAGPFQTKKEALAEKRMREGNE